MFFFYLVLATFFVWSVVTIILYGRHIGECEMSGSDVMYLAVSSGKWSLMHELDVEEEDVSKRTLKRLKRKDISFLCDWLTEKRLSRVVARGIQSRGQFHAFLADGVCDARLLIYVAKFAYK